MAQIPVVPGQGLGLPPEVVAAMLQQQQVPGQQFGLPMGGPQAMPPQMQPIDFAQNMAAMGQMAQGMSPQGGAQGASPAPEGALAGGASLEEAGVNNIRAYLQKIFSPEGLTALGLIQGAFKPTMPWESPVSNMIGGAISGYSAGVSSEAAAQKAALEGRESEANIAYKEAQTNELLQKVKRATFDREGYSALEERLEAAGMGDMKQLLPMMGRWDGDTFKLDPDAYSGLLDIQKEMIKNKGNLRHDMLKALAGGMGPALVKSAMDMMGNTDPKVILERLNVFVDFMNNNLVEMFAAEGGGSTREMSQADTLEAFLKSPFAQFLPQESIDQMYNFMKEGAQEPSAAAAPTSGGTPPPTTGGQGTSDSTFWDWPENSFGHAGTVDTVSSLGSSLAGRNSPTPTGAPPTPAGTVNDVIAYKMEDGTVVEIPGDEYRAVMNKPNVKNDFTTAKPELEAIARRIKAAEKKWSSTAGFSPTG